MTPRPVGVKQYVNAPPIAPVYRPSNCFSHSSIRRSCSGGIVKESIRTPYWLMTIPEISQRSWGLPQTSWNKCSGTSPPLLLASFLDSPNLLWSMSPYRMQSDSRLHKQVGTGSYLPHLVY